MYPLDDARNVLYVDSDIPVVRDIELAEALAPNFDAVVTAGPAQYEVNWNHPNHIVESFGDVTGGRGAPHIDQIERLIRFGEESEGSILVHCHAGISRSTSTAIGILIARGYAPNDAVSLLSNAHPTWNPFYPNELIISYVEYILDLGEGNLENIVKQYRRWW